MYYAGSRLPSLGNALQGDFLQAFNPEISPEDSFTDIEEQALISPVSPTASPPLRGVTTSSPSSPSSGKMPSRLPCPQPALSF